LETITEISKNDNSALHSQNGDNSNMLPVDLQDGLAGKYMSFKLANEEYGLEILKVKEIIGLLPITPVPNTEAHIKGVVNLRGKVIPVLDLRRKFGMTSIEPTDQTVIIVVQFDIGGKEFVMGIVVDEVLEVLNIEANQIEPPPNLGSGNYDTTFILGIGKHLNRVIFLLDIRKILNEDEIEEMQRTSLSPPTTQ
jgi:purine-binding chemotaxis protein CheW